MGYFYENKSWNFYSLFYVQSAQKAWKLTILLYRSIIKSERLLYKHGGWPIRTMFSNYIKQENKANFILKSSKLNGKTVEKAKLKHSQVETPFNILLSNLTARCNIYKLGYGLGLSRHIRADSTEPHYNSDL